MAIQIRRGTNTEWESNNSDIVAGEPAIATDAERFFVGTASGDYAEFANLDIIAPAYDTSTLYVVGDVINRQGKLYSCNTPCSGSFNPSYWDEKSLAEILKDLENEIAYAQYEIGYANGELITIDNGASEIPVKDLTVDIEAVQDLHGYDYPWVGGAGKNLCPQLLDSTITSPLTITPLDDGTVRLNGTASSTTSTATVTINLKAGTYIVTCDMGSGHSNISGLQVNGGTVATKDTPRTVTLESDGTVNLRYRINSGDSFSNEIWKPMLRLSGTTDTWTPYENICPISGWTGAKVLRTGANLWGGEKMADDIVSAVNNASGSTKGSDANGKYVTLTAGSYVNNKLVQTGLKFKENTQYTFVFKAKKSGTHTALNLIVYYTDGTYSYVQIQGQSSVIAGQIYTFVQTTSSGKTVDRITTVWGSGTAYIYYEETGLLEGVLTVDDFEPYNGTTYSVTWQTEAGTVYGGTLDVTTGVLTLTHEEIDLGSIGWGTTTVGTNIPIFYSDAISDRKGGSKDLVCSNYRTIDGYRADLANNDFAIADYNGANARVAIRDSNYNNATAADFKTAMNGVQLVYELATPQVVQLTPTQVRTLLGTNNLWNQMNSNNELAYRISNALN